MKQQKNVINHQILYPIIFENRNKFFKYQGKIKKK